MNLQEAKRVIMDYINEIITIKNTKWVEVDGEYKEVDAGYTKKELDLMYALRYRDMEHYYKLRDLLDEWI